MVRYNGGSQAGHNVVTPEGAHHTFSQFGAGSLVSGVRTILSRHVVVHPTALLVEARRLPPDILARLLISERAMITTPYHQEAGRAREIARGRSRHGTVGVGVGETVGDSIEHPQDTIFAADFRNPAALRRKMARVRERKHPSVKVDLDGWVEQAASLAGQVVPDERLAELLQNAGSVVFEGAQGALLDEKFGFHPYTTWSTCTASNALELMPPGARVTKIGVMRSHALRHGPGPLPTETEDLCGAIFDHNRENEWQGPVRYGWFDAVLVRYALEVVGGVDALAVTHLDAVRRRPTWKSCVGYRSAPERLALPGSLEEQGRLTELLQRAVPVYEECAPDEAAVLERVERLIGKSVDLVSRGPCSSDVSIRRNTV